MGPRATRNIAVLDLPSAVELISMLEGLRFGTNREVTRVVERIECISTGRRIQSERNAQVDFVIVLFWSEKADEILAFVVTVPVPHWWTSQMFLGVVYSSILSNRKICVLELQCPWSNGVEIITINDLAVKYFMVCTEKSLRAISLVTVGLHLVSGGTRIQKTLK